MLAGALFRRCHCDSTHGFLEVLRGHQSERGSAAVCDPNPPHPFAGRGTLKRDPKKPYFRRDFRVFGAFSNWGLFGFFMREPGKLGVF